MLFGEKKIIIKAEIEKGEVLNLIYLLCVPFFFLLFLDESHSGAKPKVTVGFFSFLSILRQRKSEVSSSALQSPL